MITARGMLHPSDCDDRGNHWCDKPLTDAQVYEWRERGAVVVDGLLPEATFRSALEEVDYDLPSNTGPSTTHGVMQCASARVCAFLGRVWCVPPLTTTLSSHEGVNIKVVGQ